MKSLACVLVVGLLAGTSLAQDAVTGCVSKLKHGDWVITAGRRQYRVTSGGDAFAKLNGHTVRATGSVGESDPREQAVTPPNPGSTTGATYNTIAIQRVADVSANCSGHGGATAH